MCVCLSVTTQAETVLVSTLKQRVTYRFGINFSWFLARRFSKKTFRLEVMALFAYSEKSLVSTLKIRYIRTALL